MKQGFIEVLILVGVVGAVAAIVTFNPFKEPLPNAQMTELKAEPPKCEPGQASMGACVTVTADETTPTIVGPEGKPITRSEAMSIAGDRMAFSYRTSMENDKQIRALTKRIEELEKRLQRQPIEMKDGPTSSDWTFNPISRSATGATIYCPSVTKKDGIYIEDMGTCSATLPAK